MDSLRSRSNQLYFEDKKYLRLTLDQIQRDFDMSGVVFNRAKGEVENYAEVYDLVYENVSELINSTNLQFKNLLYRIDIPEITIHKKMASGINQTLEDVVCKLIIERCLLKVLTKEKFS